MKPSVEEVHNALRQIVAHKEHKALNWAVNYAQYGTTISERAN